MRKIYVSAPGIHTGGGLVLFKSIVKSLQAYAFEVYYDKRLPRDVMVGFDDYNSKVVEVSFCSRVFRSLEISKKATSNDVLFSFNSLPPLRRSAAIVITYIHSPHFVGLHNFSKYGLKTYLRFLIEIQWLKIFRGNSDLFWVQTQTMKRLLLLKYPELNVRVVPFIDDQLHSLYYGKGRSVNRGLPVKNKYFYPASYVGHKNHLNLLEAFMILESKNIECELYLTIASRDFDNLKKRYNLSNVYNLGEISREEVFTFYDEVSALLFPSKAETFGIPLIEAAALDVPILASDLEFVCDVCDPCISFNADDPQSICDSIERFSSKSQLKTVKRDFFSSVEFVSALYSVHL
tara:strand:- start:892 stop:1935 length:1044 start_codon:yes stop_codon:yes gene_type:complete